MAKVTLIFEDLEEKNDEGKSLFRISVEADEWVKKDERPTPAQMAAVVALDATETVFQFLTGKKFTHPDGKSPQELLSGNLASVAAESTDHR